MLLVILGAGASHDSAPHNFIERFKQDDIPEWQPPLATQLFDPRAHFYQAIDAFPDSRSLVVSLRATLVNPSRNLEEELDKVSVKAATDTRAASQLMAVRYYLQQTIQRVSHNWSLLTHGCTNYHYLVERLDEWARNNAECVVYVTFNYDTLLERAIQDAGPKLHFKDLSDYVAHPRLKVFKLHGSCDWAHNVQLEQPYPSVAERDYVIEHAIDVKVPPGIVFRPDQNSGTRGQAWVPALAVPIQSKGEFECPPEHVDELARLVPEADRLLIIGWRATEQPSLRG